MKKKVTFFLIQHTFGCCKPLSSFEYFPKLILTFFFFCISMEGQVLGVPYFDTFADISHLLVFFIRIYERDIFSTYLGL